MKIRCSAGKGEMEREECIACAIKNMIPPCNFEASYLRALYNSFGHRDGIHVTDLTKCLRKSYLDHESKQVEAPHQMAAKFFGLAQHDFIEQSNMGSDNKDEEAEEQIEFEGVVGRYDLRRGPWLIDYKTTKKIYPHLLPYGEHVLQLNIYAWMLKQMKRPPIERLALVYIDNSGPSACSKCKKPVEKNDFGFLSCPTCGSEPRNAHHGVKTIEIDLMSDMEVEEIFRYRKGVLEKAYEKKEPPAGEPGWLCKYCHHS